MDLLRQLISNIYSQLGGGIGEKYKLGCKMIRYIDDNMYIVNNIDDDIIDENSEFLIGSITKLFTIIMILILQDNEKINLNDYVSKYFVNPHPDLKNIKIIELINHTSGLKLMANNFDKFDRIKKYKTAMEMVNTFLNDFESSIIVHEKGRFNYSNIGYCILASIIETITGQTIIKCLEEMITNKLEMYNTNFTETNTQLYKFNEIPNTIEDYYERTYSYGDGGLKSTIGDLIKFTKFPKLLSDNSLNMLKTFYLFNEKNGLIKLRHSGRIIGDLSLLKISYNEKWNVEKIEISLQTNYIVPKFDDY